MDETGLNVSLLEPGTKLTIETKHSVYQLLVVEGKEITVMGGMKRDGEIRFPQPIKAIFVGSRGDDMRVDWIGNGMRMELVYEDRYFISSPIKNVEIEAPDGRWSYSMDWN